MLKNVLRRPVALGASMVLASAALAMAPAASAASAEMTFDCTASVLGVKPFTTVADTDLPAQVEVGQQVDVGFTATVSVPDDVRGAAAFLYGTSVRGTAAVDTTIGGAAVPTSADFPLTQLPSSGPLVLTVTGTGSWTPTQPGTQEVRLRGYEANLQFPKADGTVQELSIPCVANASTNTLVDTVEVVDPAPTPDPEPTETPDPEPTETPDPEPTETPDPEPTQTPDPEPTETQTPDPTPTTGPQPGTNPLLALLGKAAKVIKTIACKIWKC